MAKKNVDAASAGGADAILTAADLTVIAGLASSAGRKSRNEVSSAFATLLSAPATQARLRGLDKDLAHFDGCNVEAGLARVNETAALIPIAARAEAALARVQARIVENNAWLRTFEKNLAKAQRSAAAGSPVALGLAQLVTRRSAALGTAKAAKTRAKNKRAKASKA